MFAHNYQHANIFPSLFNSRHLFHNLSTRPISSGHYTQRHLFDVRRTLHALNNNNNNNPLGNYSCLKVDLMFTRDRAFYFTTVFIPGIILVTSSFITFWLEWNAVPARVMIGKRTTSKPATNCPNSHCASPLATGTHAATRSVFLYLYL